MIEIYTIGFTEKSASDFFNLLMSHEVREIIDTRINNASQLAGFAKARDLKFLLEKVENANIRYSHNISFAPTKELLSRYRKKEITWEEYELEYVKLLDTRQIAKKVNIEEFHKKCFLCSEHGPEKCHRRLLAEYLKRVNNDIDIIHLQ